LSSSEWQFPCVFVQSPLFFLFFHYPPLTPSAVLLSVNVSLPPKHTPHASFYDSFCLGAIPPYIIPPFQPWCLSNTPTSLLTRPFLSLFGGLFTADQHLFPLVRSYIKSSPPLRVSNNFNSSCIPLLISYFLTFSKYSVSAILPHPF